MFQSRSFVLPLFAILALSLSPLALAEEATSAATPSAAQIEQLQARKLCAILEHAGGTVPYYRDMFRRLRFDPGKIGSVR